ncbi:hypothetical protein GC163_19670 [bacterium]|nr:hypothetical protein [bacterium]
MATRTEQSVFDVINSQGKAVSVQAVRLIFELANGREVASAWRYTTKTGFLVEFDEVELVYRVVNTGELLWL